MGRNYSRTEAFAPLPTSPTNLEPPLDSRFPLNVRYSGSFKPFCDPVLDKVGSPPAHRQHHQRSDLRSALIGPEALPFIAFNKRFNTSRSSSSGSNCKYFSNVVEAALKSPSL